jgi:hypothetical protein
MWMAVIVEVEEKLDFGQSDWGLLLEGLLVLALSGRHW